MKWNNKTDNPLLMSMIQEKSQQYLKVINKIKETMEDINLFADKIIEQRETRKKKSILWNTNLK